MRRQILIHRVGIAVVIHIVPTEQHLPWRSAMHKDQPWLLCSCAANAKELTLNGKTVIRLETDQLRNDQRARWIIFRVPCINYVDLPRPLCNSNGSGTLRACTDVGNL